MTSAWLSRIGAVAHEAITSARTQPVASIVSIIMVAGMCATVLLTTGRSVGAEERVVGSIDSEGTRSIIVHANSNAGLTPSVLSRLSRIQGIEWSAAFGPALDSENVALPGGVLVPVRLAWGSDLSHLGIGRTPDGLHDVAWASQSALSQLGMPEGSGGIATLDGADYSIQGRLTVPDYLKQLQPLVVSPQPTHTGGSVAILVVIAREPDLVAPLTTAVRSVLDVDNPTDVTITTSQNLADLRGLIKGQLGSFSRSLVLIVFALTAVLVAAILYGLVMLRRKDFGRRRALGAPQSLIVALILIQTAALAAVGAVIGTAGAAIGLAGARDPLPGVDFFLAVDLLAVMVGVIAAVIPAVAAARREPIRELRVP